MGLFGLFKNSEKPDKTNTNTTNKMSIFPNIGYQFDYIKTYKHSAKSDVCYLIEGTNLIKAKADLEKVNVIIKEHVKEEPAFSKFKIDVPHARFKSENMRKGYSDFCCLFCNPLTPSGKPAKFPLKMRIDPLSADEMSRRTMSKNGKTIHG